MQRSRMEAARHVLPALDRGSLDARIEATAREIDVLSRRLSQLRADPGRAAQREDEASTVRRHILARRRFLNQLEALRGRARP